MQNRRLAFLPFIVMALSITGNTQAKSATCDASARNVAGRVSQPLNLPELAEILVVLNETKNRTLPAKFVTKREAQDKGWKPGHDLWSVRALKGKSIGGDYFGNRERRLLPFPSHFGRNLDALFDVLMTDIKGSVEIIWKNSSASKDVLRVEYDGLVSVLREVQAERADFRITLS